MLYRKRGEDKTMTTPEHASQGADSHDNDHDDEKAITIFIDGNSYETPEHELTGTQIRHLGTPPIGQDRDLWLEGPGGLDKLIGDDEEVHLHDDMRFFTVPKVINPGRA
jgi:Multiubiquitin